MRQNELYELLDARLYYEICVRVSHLLYRHEVVDSEVRDYVHTALEYFISRPERLYGYTETHIVNSIALKARWLLLDEYRRSRREISLEDPDDILVTESGEVQVDNNENSLFSNIASHSSDRGEVENLVEEKLLLQELLEAMTPRQRVAWELYSQGYTPKEIAQLTKSTEFSIYKLLNRSVEKAREKVLANAKDK